MRKKLLGLALILGLALAVAGCAKAPSAKDIAVIPPKPDVPSAVADAEEEVAAEEAGAEPEAAPFEAPGNLAENADMEEGPLQKPLEQTTEQAHDGTYAGKLAARPGQKNTVVSFEQHIPLEGANCLSASVWGRVTEYSQGLLRLRVVYYDQNGKSLGTSVLGNVRGTTSKWELYSVAEKRQDWPGGAVSAGFFFGWYGEDGVPPSGTIYLDGLTFYLDDLFCL